MDKLFPDDDDWTLEAVKESLIASNGEDVNARSPITGRAILHEACIRGKKDIVQYLLNHTTCDLEVRTMLGHATPLHLAAQAGERSIAFLLLSHGANATARDRFGATPLHYCTKRSVAVHLTQFGAKILTANFKRKTAAAMIQANEFADAELKAFAMELAQVEYRAVRRKTHQAPRS